MFHCVYSKDISVSEYNTLWLFFCTCHTNVHHCTGKLRLKVPWSNLYTAPVVVEVDGVYIIAGPSSGENRNSRKSVL